MIDKSYSMSFYNTQQYRDWLREEKVYVISVVVFNNELVVTYHY